MKTKSRTANTLFNTAAGIAAKIATLLSGFVLRSLFIRLLGIEYAGVSTLFTDILSALSIAELGISTAITYAMYKPIAKGDMQKVAQLMDIYKKAYRIVSAVVFTVGMCLVPFLKYLVKLENASDVKENITVIYILYVINSAISYLLVYKTTLLTAHQEHRYVSYVQSIACIVKIIAVALVLVVFRNFTAYLITELVITRLQNVACSWYAGKRYPEAAVKPSTPLPKEERRALFKDLSALMMYKVSNALLRSVDSVIVSSMFGTVWVGYMGNYSLLNKRINSVINQFYDSASPSIGNLSAESDADKQYRTYRILQFMAFWMCCFCSVSLLTLYNPFIELWLGINKSTGKSYTMMFPFVIIMVANFYVNAIIHPITTFRTANGLFVQGKFRPVIMLVINAGLSVLFAWWWGRYGVQWGVFGVKAATLVAQIVTLQWFDPWLVYKHAFKRSVSEYFKTTFGRLALVSLLCAATYALGMLVTFLAPDMNKYLLLAVKALLCVIVPNTAIILIYRKTFEYTEFMRILKGILSKYGKSKKADAA